MGGNSSKEAVKAPTVKKTTVSSNGKVYEKEDKSPEAEMQRYGEFRNKLMSFSLGEAAYDYGERLFRENPESPEIMALLAETAALYDEHKIKAHIGRVESRPHWADRMDLLQRGIDVSRKCIRDNPQYAPCHRTYMMCATRAADAEYNSAYIRGLGDQIRYNGLMKRGEKALEVHKDAQVFNALAALNGRVLSRWWTVHGLTGMYYGVPSTKSCAEKAINYAKEACELEPAVLEFRCRLAMAQFQAGDLMNARKNYVKVRDEMTVRDLYDERWQAIAHTQLSTGFQKNKWNVPFA